MPESGAVERVHAAMHTWMMLGIPADFRQLYVDMKHIIDCIPASVKTEENMRYDNPNIRSVYHPDGHVTVACRSCGWDADSRIHPNWETDADAHTMKCAATVTRQPARDHGPITIGRIVHYRSHGTPNGEYTPECRAAIITGTAEWVTTETEKATSYSASEGRPIRAQQQWLFDDAVSLAVFNPDGVFLKGPIRHNENKPGGTWHWPCNG